MLQFLLHNKYLEIAKDMLHSLLHKRYLEKYQFNNQNFKVFLIIITNHKKRLIS